MKLAKNPVERTIAVGSKKSRSQVVWTRPTPPPWPLLDGALLEMWRELEEALKAWNYQTQRPVPAAAIERDNGNWKMARARQAASAAVIIRQFMGEIRVLLGDYQPETLALGHRNVRKLVIAWLEHPAKDPKPEDDPMDLNGPALVFARRATLAIRAIRTLMQEDALRRMKRRDKIAIRVPDDERPGAFKLPKPEASDTASEAVANLPLDNAENERAGLSSLA